MTTLPNQPPAPSQKENAPVRVAPLGHGERLRAYVRKVLVATEEEPEEAEEPETAETPEHE